jgi:hypothetical protein
LESSEVAARLAMMDDLPAVVVSDCHLNVLEPGTDGVRHACDSFNVPGPAVILAGDTAAAVPELTDRSRVEVCAAPVTAEAFVKAIRNGCKPSSARVVTRGYAGACEDPQAADPNPRPPSRRRSGSVTGLTVCLMIPVVLEISRILEADRAVGWFSMLLRNLRAAKVADESQPRRFP